MGTMRETARASYRGNQNASGRAGETSLTLWVIAAPEAVCTDSNKARAGDSMNIGI